MIKFPREQNGHIDDGSLINKDKCPNCQSANFRSTISVEYCPNCKLQCDYWGAGANKIYNEYLYRKWEKEENDRSESLKERERDNYFYDSSNDY
jgi:hypothetical protein